MVPYADNVTKYQFDVSMDPNNKDQVMVKAKHTFTGNSRIANSNKALYYELYQPEDWRNYGGWDDKESMSAAQQENFSAQISKYKAEARILKPKFMEDQLKQDFSDVVKYDRFRLVQDGRHMRRQQLIFEEDFTLGEMVLFAGKSILLKLPGFLTNQLKLTGEERFRNYDANLGVQKSIEYQVKFIVPAGYKVFGLAELNQLVENETGIFKSEAKFENGTVIVNAVKTYKQNIVSKDDWPKMLEWIDAASNFCQQKILLRQ